MALPERAYQRDDEVDAALRALGDGSLDRLVLSSALLFAEAERRTCTENDPGILMGMIGWGRPIRYLREVMRPKGWLREEPSSLPLIVSPDRSIGITVSAGNDDTGNSGAPFATTKWRKGPMMQEWVEPSRQMTFLDGEGESSKHDLPDELWLLLVRRFPTSIAYELSRPTSITRGGRLRCGGARILFTPLPIDETVVVQDQDFDEGYVPSPEVSVERI